MSQGPSMPPRFARRSLSFIVRLWSLPPDPVGEDIWRGQIEHVGSGKIATFQVPAALLALVAAQVGGLAAWADVAEPTGFPSPAITEEGD